MLRDVDSFYLAKADPAKSCLLALRQLIMGHHDNVTETVKYGMPCFCFGKNPLCYLWSDKISHEPYILMVDGKLMNHPNLETGDRARMKILRVNPAKDLPIKIIADVLSEAIALRSASCGDNEVCP